jgi:Zn-dependent protease with chaperone function
VTTLAARALIALVLTAAYYALALGVVTVLIALPFYLAIATRKPAFVWIAAFAYPFAFAIWRGAFPKHGEPDHAGLRLDPDDHPDLFALIAEVASACGVRTQPDVHLTLGADAAITEVRRRPFGRHPALMLGLALLDVLNVPALKSLLAHELTHYTARDTLVGRWLYHTQLRLDRTLRDLEDDPLGLSVLFRSYARLFWRVTAAVRRREESFADEVAARLYGGDAAHSCLRANHDASLAFSGYWQHDLVPVLDAGYRPPVVEGFRQFMESEDANGVLNESWERELGEPEDRYAAHPPVRARLALAQRFATGAGERPRRSALGLVRAPERLAAQVLAQGASRERVASLTPIGWDEVVDRVWMPRWRSVVAAHFSSLRGLTLGSLADACEPAVAGAAACIVLGERGWWVQAAPGTRVKVVRGATTLYPFESARDAGSWREACERAGISAVAASSAPLEAASKRRRSMSASLELRPDRKSKAPTVVGMTIVGMLAIPIGLMAMVMPVTEGAPTAAVVFGIVVGAVVIGLFAWFCLVHARQVFRPATVRVEGDSLRIDYPVLFKQPLTVPHGSLRVVGVDSASDHRDRRVPVRAQSWEYAGDPDAEVAWLWTMRAGSPMPMLSATQKRPNAVMLFDPPVTTPPLRREVAHGPLKGEALMGLLMDFADTAAALDVFAALGVARDLTVTDLEWIHGRFLGEEVVDAGAPAVA